MGESVDDDDYIETIGLDNTGYESTTDTGMNETTVHDRDDSDYIPDETLEANPKPKRMVTRGQATVNNRGFQLTHFAFDQLILRTQLA